MSETLPSPDPLTRPADSEPADSEPTDSEPAATAPPDAMAADEALRGLSIAAVERDTGLPKDTLRVWERRYGFPRPLRNALDERLYPPEQVHKLQLLRRLVMHGHRPGRIAGLPLEQLEAMAARHGEQTPADNAGSTELGHFLALLHAHDIERLRRELQQAQLRMGLGRFVTEVVAPLTCEVGAAWMRGELQVFEEHQFSELVHRVLRNGIAAIPALDDAAWVRPRVLLTTIPQEPHGLGLLMVEAMLALEGCHCVSLGVQTPLPDMLMAVQAHHADILLLSFSPVPTRGQVLDALAALRSALPSTVEIWAGGSSPALERAGDGVRVIRPLQALAPELAAWRAAQQAR